SELHVVLVSQSGTTQTQHVPAPPHRRSRCERSRTSRPLFGPGASGSTCAFDLEPSTASASGVARPRGRLASASGRLASARSPVVVRRRAMRIGSSLVLAAVGVLLLALAATSSVRRIGDGNEYLAMAVRLSALRPPSLE